MDKFFNIDEAMIDYSEMTSFNFNSPDYFECCAQKEIPQEYAHQKYTFKFGNFDVVDMLQAVFAK
ncbi:MAG TPA: hypothetical protein PKI94_06960 [Candidatus Gastranaerophilaceae bacterium]|nr:hypothetical protein [Candidatus Gastranaerophilaceae bacterium]